MMHSVIKFVLYKTPFLSFIKMLSDVKKKKKFRSITLKKAPLRYSARRFQESDELIYDLLLCKNI